ncbi:MAG: NfeD family protein [Acidobacteria bacterium]|nr:NfeD family protein [Acidobacteriota bacterium]
MADIFQNLSAFAVFLTLAGFGFLFLLISFVFGEIFEHLDFGHDMDAGADHDLGHGGPSFFSPRVLSVFLTAFGGTGAIASYYGFSPLPASGFGFVSGLIFASLIFSFAKFLFGQQASTEVKQTDIMGRTGRVIVGIPKDGVGQIRCSIGEELIDKVARSADNAAVPENTIVRVEQVLGEMVLVRRVDG